MHLPPHLDRHHHHRCPHTRRHHWFPGQSTRVQMWPSSPAGVWDGIPLINFFTFIFMILVAPWHPTIQFVFRTHVVYWDISVSASNLKQLMHHFRGRIVKKNSVINTSCFRADDHGRRWVLPLLDQTLDCSKSVFYTNSFGSSLVVCSRYSSRMYTCLQHQARLQLATQCSAAGCIRTTVINVVAVVRAIRSVRFPLSVGSVRRNTIVLLLLQESIAQCGAGKHD